MDRTKWETLLVRGIQIGVITALLTPLIIGPFSFSFSEYPKALFFRTVIEIIVILYLLLTLVGSRYLPKRSPVLLAVCVFVGVLILAAVSGFNAHRSFWGDLQRGEGVILHLHLLAFFFVIVGVFQKKEQWFTLFRWAVGVGTLSAIAALLQKIGIASFYGISLPERVSGTLANPDFFAAYLVLVLFLGFILAAEAANVKHKIIWLALVVINFAALLLSGTRASWGGMGIGIVALFLLWFFWEANLARKTRRTILLGIFVFALFVLFTVSYQDQLGLAKNYTFSRAMSVFDARPLASRLVAWEIALAAFTEKPILGWGPESFSFVSDKYFQVDSLEYVSATMDFDRVHNKFLALMLDAGVLGIVSYLALFAAVFFLLFSYAKRKSKDQNSLTCLILISLFVAYGVQNIFTFDTISTYLLFFLVLGFVHVQYRTKVSSARETRMGRVTRLFSAAPFVLWWRSVLVVLLILLVGIVFFQLNVKTAAAYISLSYASRLERSQFSKALSEYQEILESNTLFQKDIALEITRRVINKQAGGVEEEMLALLSSLKLALADGLDRADRRYLYSHERIARINERIYLLTGDPTALEEMEQVAQKALRFNDEKLVFYELIGEARILQGLYTEGEAFFQKASERLPGRLYTRAEPFRKLGNAYFRAGNKVLAARYFKKAFTARYYTKKFALPPLRSAKPVPKLTLNDASFAEQVAFLHYELGDLAVAQQIHERAVEIYPEHREWLELHWEKNTPRESVKK